MVSACPAQIVMATVFHARRCMSHDDRVSLACRRGAPGSQGPPTPSPLWAADVENAKSADRHDGLSLTMSGMEFNNDADELGFHEIEGERDREMYPVDLRCTRRSQKTSVGRTRGAIDEGRCVRMSSRSRLVANNFREKGDTMEDLFAATPL